MNGSEATKLRLTFCPVPVNSMNPQGPEFPPGIGLPEPSSSQASFMVAVTGSGTGAVGNLEGIGLHHNRGEHAAFEVQ